MDQVSFPEFLTLEETAQYLRLPEEKILNKAIKGDLPGRKIEDDWRFLKVAIDDWLRANNSRSILLAQAGVFADDETLVQLRNDVYEARGRSEVEEA